MGKAIESLQKIGREKGLSHRAAVETALGSLAPLHGDQFSAPYLSPAPGLHSCQQQLGGKLDKPLGCHKVWKLCALWLAHEE